MFGDVCAIFVILTVLAALLVLLRACQQRFSPHPELIRKALHGMMGAITLTFPLLFQSSISVFILGAIAASGLTFLKKSQDAHGGLGSVLCSVKRKSYGEVAFAVAIALLFMLSRDNYLFYSIPILILTLADSCSAIIGIFFGKHPFTTSDGTKTAEGSFAFFITTFFATIIPLLLFSGLAPLNALLISFLLGSLVMMFEAIAWRGLDNFLIPISAYFLLHWYAELPVASLVVRCVAALIFLAFGFAWRRRTTLHDAAVIGASLACYTAMVVGGVMWVLAPMTVFMLYKFVLPVRYHSMPRVHSLRSVVAVVATGLMWLFAFRCTGNHDYFFSYTLSFAANFVMISCAHLKKLRKNNGAKHPALLAGWSFFSWLVFFLPYLAMTGWGTEHLLQCALALPITASAAFMFYHQRCGRLSGNLRWATQFSIASLLSPLSLCL